MGNVKTLIKTLHLIFGDKFKQRKKPGVTQEEMSGRKANDIDVKVKR